MNPEKKIVLLTLLYTENITFEVHAENAHREELPDAQSK